MATVENEDPLSLEQKNNFDELQRLISSGKVSLQKDSDGNLSIVCNEGTEKGPKSSDVRTQAAEFVEQSKSVKRAKSSLGLSVVFDESKIKVGPFGRYSEARQFEQTGKVLGEGKFAKEVKVVRDRKSGTEHALKTITLTEFSGDELLSWLDLSDSDTFPSLYMVRLNENKVSFHMEIIKHGVTLSVIIEDNMLLTKDPKLMWPFSLCIFYKLLKAVAEMHDKNWAHCDLHGGNVLITKDTLMLKVLDFGKAQKLRSSEFNDAAMKDDILKALRLFCSVYTGKEFMDINAMEKMIVTGTLMKEVLSDTPHMTDKEKEELEELIMKTYDVIQDPKQAGYGSTSSVMEQIQDKIFRGRDRMDVLKRAAAHLFPDFYKDFGLHAGPEAQDTHTGPEAGEATGLPADFNTSLDALAVHTHEEAGETAGDTHTQAEAGETAGDTHTQAEAGETAGDTHSQTEAGETASDTQDEAGKTASDTQDEAGETSGDTHTQDESDAIDTDFKGLNIHR